MRDFFSQWNSLMSYLVEQHGVRVRLRVLPLVHPYGVGRNADIGVQHNIEGCFCHIQLDRQTSLAAFAAQKNGNVRIAVLLMITPGAASD